MKNNQHISITDELIGRYLTGEASPDEAMALHDWLKHAGNRSHFEALQASWQASLPSRTPRPVHRVEAWKALQEKIAPVQSMPTVQTRVFLASPGLALRLAASVLLVVSIGLVAYVKLRDTPPALKNVASGNVIREFTLPDRSTAVLNKNTVIEYPEAFGSDKREVSFKQGEAFFRVASDAEKPFIIHTTLADVQVVGTAFNIIQHGEALEVSVDEGKVLVVTATSRQYLEAGTRARVSTGADPVQIDRTADLNTWGYATRKFAFKDTPLSAVVQCIEKAYPYSIRLHNPALGNCKLTVTFDHLSAEEMLTLIAETLNLTVTKHDTVYTMEGSGCP